MKNLTIMFTDMKGYTSLTSSLSRQQIQHLLATQENIVFPLVHRWHGQVIKNLGDGHLIIFDSPTDALLCGIGIQQTICTHNATPNVRHFELRIAVNAGEVMVEDNDVFGEPVNTAARILSITPPGAVYLTDAVFLSMNKNEVPSVEVGTKLFKGVPEAVKIYRVVMDASEASKVQKVRLGLIEAVANLNKEGDGKQGHARKSWLKPIKYGILFLGLLLALGMTIPKQGTGFVRSMHDDVKGLEADVYQTATPSAPLSPSPSPTVTSTVTPTPTPTPTIQPTPTPSLTPLPLRKYKNGDNNGD